MTHSIEATVPFTWEHEVDGFYFATYELIATVVSSDNRPVITALQMEGNKPHPSNEHLLCDLPDGLKGQAFTELSDNELFVEEAENRLKEAGYVFQNENSFESLFVKPFGDTFGVAAQ
ncbi:hypothetical protein [Kiloniella litopenaei]|uniref:hypothetical protein n=1 Tax=Kiloniella litopenaei TaxID=1549748 RepID=UPI003BAA6395